MTSIPILSIKLDKILPATWTHFISHNLRALIILQHSSHVLLQRTDIQPKTGEKSSKPLLSQHKTALHPGLANTSAQIWASILLVFKYNFCYILLFPNFKLAAFLFFCSLWHNSHFNKVTRIVITDVTRITFPSSTSWYHVAKYHLKTSV